jgi:A/G-specific adenine glycosylase
MQFSTKIINWYHKNKRELPWRQEVNPYFIWLSEVILQQTRVSQGLPYYLKFVKNYPSIQELADASEENILKDWQGLGYYSRARNMHSAAKTMVKKHKGEFPQTYNEILELQGIGPYTAAAIGSFAFNLPYPVVDGNVQRVVARIFGIEKPVNSSIGKKMIEEILGEVFDPKRPGDFNQAIMEFGAMHCKPQQPLCSTCPFNKECFALKNNLVQVLPVKEKKVKVRARYFLYVVPQKGKHEFIVKRIEDDIWKNLYQFPLIETEEPLLFPNDKMIFDILKKEKWKTKFKIKHISHEYKHVLTHRIIYARFVTVEMDKDAKPEKDWIKKEMNNHEIYAFPVLISKYFDDRDKTSPKYE